ncbi:MAG: exodeoxyribonuclease III [Leptospirillum sp.]
MKLASWNVNSLKVRLDQVKDWLSANTPDCLCLQETKTTNEDFPHSTFLEMGYQSLFNGQKTYNGVAILSRHPLRDPVYDIPGFDDHQKRVISADVNGIRVVNCYIPNGQDLGTEKFQYKMEWLTALTKYLETLKPRNLPVILTGDFNITPTDLDLWDPEGMRDQIFCSKEEREHLQRMFDMGFSDCFRQENPETRQYSWWDYRQGMFRQNKGLRIDLILASAPLKPLHRHSFIDPDPRRSERPSDHTPVVSEFDGLIK